MRKLKVKVKTAKNNIVYKKLDASMLYMALSDFFKITMDLFKLKKENVIEMLEDKGELLLNSDLLPLEFYPQLDVMVKTHLIMQSFLVDKLDIGILKNQKLQKTYLFEKKLLKNEICNTYLKGEKIDYYLNKVLDFLTVYRIIHISLNTTDEELLKVFEIEDIKEMRLINSKYEELLASILYDICNYQSYYKKGVA